MLTEKEAKLEEENRNPKGGKKYWVQVIYFIEEKIVFLQNSKQKNNSNNGNSFFRIV